MSQTIYLNSSGSNPNHFQVKCPNLTIEPNSEIALLEGKGSQNFSIEIDNSNDTFCMIWSNYGNYANYKKFILDSDLDEADIEDEPFSMFLPPEQFKLKQGSFHYATTDVGEAGNPTAFQEAYGSIMFNLIDTLNTQSKYYCWRWAAEADTNSESRFGAYGYLQKPLLTRWGETYDEAGAGEDFKVLPQWYAKKYTIMSEGVPPPQSTGTNDPTVLDVNLEWTHNLYNTARVGDFNPDQAKAVRLPITDKFQYFNAFYEDRETYTQIISDSRVDNVQDYTGQDATLTTINAFFIAQLGEDAGFNVDGIQREINFNKWGFAIVKDSQISYRNADGTNYNPDKDWLIYPKNADGTYNYYPKRVFADPPDDYLVADNSQVKFNTDKSLFTLEVIDATKCPVGSAARANGGLFKWSYAIHLDQPPEDGDPAEIKAAYGEDGYFRQSGEITFADFGLLPLRFRCVSTMRQDSVDAQENYLQLRFEYAQVDLTATPATEPDGGWEIMYETRIGEFLEAVYTDATDNYPRFASLDGEGYRTCIACDIAQKDNGAGDDPIKSLYTNLGLDSYALDPSTTQGKIGQIDQGVNAGAILGNVNATLVYRAVNPDYSLNIYPSIPCGLNISNLTEQNNLIVFRQEPPCVVFDGTSNDQTQQVYFLENVQNGTPAGFLITIPSLPIENHLAYPTNGQRASVVGQVLGNQLDGDIDFEVKQLIYHKINTPNRINLSHLEIKILDLDGNTYSSLDGTTHLVFHIQPNQLDTQLEAMRRLQRTIPVEKNTTRDTEISNQMSYN